jgi:hypothetical protein
MVEGKYLNFHELEAGNRSRMKILTINPNQDLPLDLIKSVTQKALDLYKTGTIKVKEKVLK